MLSNIQQTTLVILICLSVNRAKILRNNALMTKMVSHFRGDNEITEGEHQKSDIVLSRMQNVLCKNFPTIPCELITQDQTLKKLIEKSIQQINYKKPFITRTTPFPGYLTLFPVINSEDLSNFLQVRDNTFTNKKHGKTRKKESVKLKNSRDKHGQKNKKAPRAVYNRKKIRKFYPHKVKYRDKVVGSVKEEFVDRSEDRLSMSVEVPDMTLVKKHQHFAYKMEPESPPVWRIDYMKHGEPNLNMFAFNGDGGKGNMKTPPNMIMDDNFDQAVRKDVLHPDVYINKNFIRKNSVVANVNSEPID